MSKKYLNEINNYCIQVFFYLYFFILGGYLFVNKQFIQLYNLLNKINLSKRLKNKLLLYGGFEEENEEEIIETNEQNEIVVKEVKYEDKYLEDIKGLRKELTFTWAEIGVKQEKFEELFKKYKTDLLNEKYKINEEMVNKGIKYLEYDENSDDDNNNSNKRKQNNIEEEQNEENKETNKEERKKELEKEINELRSKIVKLEEQTEEKLIEMAKKEATDFITKERLDKLKNNFIIEKTPLGNVIMYYNNDRESFEYYSDNTIPYRYLETVGRKYVKTFNCKKIYVDMDFELKEFERKQNQEKEKIKLEKEERERIRLENENENENKNEKVLKKDVFAKFKNYNKESGTGRVNKGAAPPKNSIPNNRIPKADEKVILKENANRYTCEGKMANFNFLKKTDRKKVDKKYALSFADYKKILKK